MQDLQSFMSVISKRRSPPLRDKYLKWENVVVGFISKGRSVLFTEHSDKVPITLAEPNTIWSSEEYKSFLSERIPSRGRRDIEKILRRCGLVDYDEFRIAEVTRAFNARDMFWIADSADDKMELFLDQVFKDIFLKNVDRDGSSLVSPEGVNTKRYGVSRGWYGLFKHRLHPTSTDIESEVAVYNLSKLLGINCCPAWLDKDTNKTVVFSKFQYDFSKEYLIHARRLFSEGELTGELYKDLVNKVPLFKRDIQQMMVLDFITRQTDRHLSNLAFKISGDSVDFYPLYDNGRSLFFEDSTYFTDEALTDIERYSSEFGEIGTYYDIIGDISLDTDISSLANLNVSQSQIVLCYEAAGLKGERLRAASKWTDKCLGYLRALSEN